MVQMAEEEEDRRRAGMVAKTEEEAVSDEDRAQLRDIILDLIEENTQGLDKVRVSRACRLWSEMAAGGGSLENGVYHGVSNCSDSSHGAHKPQIGAACAASSI